MIGESLRKRVDPRGLRNRRAPNLRSIAQPPARTRRRLATMRQGSAHRPCLMERRALSPSHPTAIPNPSLNQPMPSRHVDRGPSPWRRLTQYDRPQHHHFDPPSTRQIPDIKSLYCRPAPNQGSLAGFRLDRRHGCPELTRWRLFGVGWLLTAPERRPQPASFPEPRGGGIGKLDSRFPFSLCP